MSGLPRENGTSVARLRSVSDQTCLKPFPQNLDHSLSRNALGKPPVTMLELLARPARTHLITARIAPCGRIVFIETRCSALGGGSRLIPCRSFRRRLHR